VEVHFFGEEGLRGFPFEVKIIENLGEKSLTGFLNHQNESVI